MLPRVTILPTVCHTYPAKIVQALWSFQLGGEFGGILVRDVKVLVCASSHTSGLRPDAHKNTVKRNIA